MDEGTDVKPESASAALSQEAGFARSALLAPRKGTGAVMLVLSGLAFWFVMMGDGGPVELLILIGVLVVHELGHLVSMRLFGFTELGMFFLPGFGAAAMGQKPGARASEHAIVSLCGPLPGILLALPMLYWAEMGSWGADPVPLYTQVILMLIFLNLLNLLPIPPLDGGRFFEVLVFARWPVMDCLFRFAAIGALVWIGMQDLPMIWVVAALMLLTTRYHIRVAFEAASLRKQMVISPNVEELREEELLAIYDAADRVVGTANSPAARDKVLPVMVRNVFDRSARQSAGVLATLGLLVLWGLGCFLALIELAYLALDPSKW